MLALHAHLWPEYGAGQGGPGGGRGESTIIVQEDGKPLPICLSQEILESGQHARMIRLHVRREIDAAVHI